MPHQSGHNKELGVVQLSIYYLLSTYLHIYTYLHISTLHCARHNTAASGQSAANMSEDGDR